MNAATELLKLYTALTKMNTFPPSILKSGPDLAQFNIKYHVQSYLLITNQFFRGNIGLLHCYSHLIYLFLDPFRPQFFAVLFIKCICLHYWRRYLNSVFILTLPILGFQLGYYIFPLTFHARKPPYKRGIFINTIQSQKNGYLYGVRLFEILQCNPIRWSILPTNTYLSTFHSHIVLA